MKIMDKAQIIRNAIEQATGRVIPINAVWADQCAFCVRAYDAEYICVFMANVPDDYLYRIGLNNQICSI